MTKDRLCLFFYGMLLENPRWMEGHVPPYPDERGVYFSFARNLPDLEPYNEEDEPFEDLDDHWRRRGDSVSIGQIYDYDYGDRTLPFLAIRETLHQELTFDLPIKMDRTAWDRLLRTKCESHHLIYEAFTPPRFYIILFPMERNFDYYKKNELNLMAKE